MKVANIYYQDNEIIELTDKSRIERSVTSNLCDEKMQYIRLYCQVKSTFRKIQSAVSLDIAIHFFNVSHILKILITFNFPITLGYY